MKRFLMLAMGCAILSSPSYATLSFVTNPASLSATDSVNWSQLGADGTSITQNFSATSGGSVSISGTFTGAGGGLAAVVCPQAPSCSWTTSGAGINAGDTLLYAFDPVGNAGTGPISLSFSTMAGAGAWIQADSTGTFTVQIQVYNGATLLGTGTTTSDSSGDPVFLGALSDAVGTNFTKIVFSLTSCPGCGGTGDLGDFAIDSLLLKAPAAGPVPEPGSILLLASGMAGIVCLRRRFSR